MNCLTLNALVLCTWAWEPGAPHSGLWGCCGLRAGNGLSGPGRGRRGRRLRGRYPHTPGPAPRTWRPGGWVAEGRAAERQAAAAGHTGRRLASSPRTWAIATRTQLQARPPPHPPRFELPASATAPPRPSHSAQPRPFRLISPPLPASPSRPAPVVLLPCTPRWPPAGLVFCCVAEVFLSSSFAPYRTSASVQPSLSSL